MFYLLVFNKRFISIVGFFLLYLPAISHGVDWTITPSLKISQIYSDNIRLSDQNKRSALVTDVSPIVSINSESSISNFKLNYRLQALYNQGGESGIDLKNQLGMKSNYQLVRDRLFVDSTSSISQQNISNRNIASDNISGGDNSSTISTFRLSPYWTPHFKNFADGEFRVTYDRVASESGNSQLSKTNSFSQSFQLNSGNYFSKFNWAASFINSNRSRNNGDDVNFQSSNFRVQYSLHREFSVFAQGGHSNNSFSSNSNNNRNGISYTFGGEWRPSKRLRVEAGYGNNLFVTVETLPFNRLRWVTTYSRNDIGLNTGDTWDTQLKYNTRRATWNLSYNERTTTTQQVLLEQQTVFITDPDDPNIVNQFDIRLTSLVDAVFVAKRADLSVSYITGKSRLNASIYRTTRDFELRDDDEEISGASLSWNWTISNRLRSSFRTGWQKTSSDGQNPFTDKRYDASFSLTRNILSKVNGTVIYRFIEQSSSDGNNEYSENRITASLSLKY